MNNLLNTPQLSQYLNVTQKTIYVWRKEGMPTVKIGRYYRYKLDDVMAWLEKRSA